MKSPDLTIKIGTKVKNHMNARGIVYDINTTTLDWFPVKVIITEPHPLFNVGEKVDSKKEDLKPIIRLYGTNN